MYKNKHRVYFHDSLTEQLRLKITTALVFSQICYLSAADKPTFMSSIATHLKFSVDTVSKAILKLENAGLITRRYLNEDELRYALSSREKYRVNFDVDTSNEVVSDFYNSVKAIINNKKDKALNLVLVDLSIVDNLLADERYRLSSAHLHKAAVVISRLANTASAKAHAIGKHVKTSSMFTVEVNIRRESNKLNVCYNTARDIFNTINMSKIFSEITKCHVTKNLIFIIEVNKIENEKLTQFKSSINKMTQFVAIAKRKANTICTETLFKAVRPATDELHRFKEKYTFASLNNSTQITLKPT